MTNQKISRDVHHLAHRMSGFQESSRIVPEEAPIAMSYNGTTQAVMMATPGDLEDFAIGFSLTENIVTRIEEIEALDIVAFESGIDIQMKLAKQPEQRLSARRRFMAGPVGCGLCGIDSIEQALRPLHPLEECSTTFTTRDIAAAVASLGAAQALNAKTHATHGAGFFRPGEGLFAVREDIGRHNALDKLIGAVAREGLLAEEGIVAITSRVSVEMVQKAVMLGVPVLAAISAPTALAIRTAEAANLTLVALVRDEEFDIYTHCGRIIES